MRESPVTVAPTLRTSLTASASFLLILVVAATPVSAEDSAPVGTWVEGELRIPSPAVAEAEVHFEKSWMAHWRPATATGAPSFTDFSLHGPRLVAKYYETVTPKGDNLANVNAPVDAPIMNDVWTNFEVTLTPRTDTAREAFLSGQGGVLDRTPAKWSLSTAAPTDQVLETRPEHSLTGVPGAGAEAWNILLEGTQAHLTTEGAKLSYLYGYDVLIRGDENKAGKTYATGDLGEKIAPAPGAAPADSGPTDPIQIMMLTKHEGFLVLTLEEGHADVRSENHTVRILAPELPLAGTVAHERLAGHLASSSLARDYKGQPATLEGTFLMAAEPAASADAPHVMEVNGYAVDFTPASERFVPAAPAAALVASALAGAALLAAAAYWTREWLIAPVVGLYTRLTKTDMGNSSIRERLLEIIRQDPGIGMQEAAQRAGCGWGSVAYHVGVLQKLGLIEARRVGLRRCLFENGGRYRNQFNAIGLLRRKTVRDLLLAIEETPGLTQTQLAGRVGITQAGVSKVLLQLRQEGLVDGDAIRGDGVLLTDRGRTLLAAPATT